MKTKVTESESYQKEVNAAVEEWIEHKKRNTTQHTPGPWTFSISRWPNGEWGGPPYIFAPNAKEHPTEGRHVATLCKLEEVDANARLIAAAPELLAALEAAVQRMEAVAESIPVQNRAEGVSQATHVAHMAGHLAQHAKIARAAIAKATGQEAA